MAKVPSIPKFYWDGGYLSKLEAKMGDECIFLCLSPVSFRMLTDMTAMLLWPTRYKEGEVPELGRTAYRELNVPCLEDLHSLLDSIQLQNSDWLQSRFDDLAARMTELEDMNITQTVNTGGCGCGNGGGTSTTNTVYPPFIDPEDTGVDPAYDDTVYTVVDAVKCRVANWLADKTIQVLRGMANISAGAVALVTVAAALIGIFAALNGVPGDGIIWGLVVFEAAKALIELGQLDDFTASDLDVLANEIASMNEQFICALYSWATAGELSSVLLGFLYARIDEVSITVGWSAETVDKAKGLFSMVFGSRFSNYVVQNVGRIVPADFVSTYDCKCGATGDTCPTRNVVLAGVGSLPSGDLSGTTQAFASQFNSSTGYHEIIFELADNYCVSIDNATYAPTEAHQTCSGGVMAASDGSCLRRFVARSLAPFATAVQFQSLTTDCYCVPLGAIAFDHTFTFDNDMEYWVSVGGRDLWEPLSSDVRSNPRASKPQGLFTFDEKDFSQLLGGGLGCSEIFIRVISIDSKYDLVDESGKTSHLEVFDLAHTSHIYQMELGQGVYHTNNFDLNYNVGVSIAANSPVFGVHTLHNGIDTNGQNYFDNIRIRGWYKLPPA